MLEANNRPTAAYDVYASALARLRAASGLTGRERVRAVALAHKLGEMAEANHEPEEDEERWLSFAVEETVRVLRDEGGKGKAVQAPADGDAEGMLAELELPWWVDKVDVASPMEALGRFYARTGKAK